MRGAFGVMGLAPDKNRLSSLIFVLPVKCIDIINETDEKMRGNYVVCAIIMTFQDVFYSQVSYI